MKAAERIGEVYAAFGRGDVAFILERLADDVEWDYGFVSTGVPWLQHRRGRAEVAKFFQSLGALEFHRFEPKTLLEEGNLVVALLDMEATVKANGRQITEQDGVHIWKLDGDGQIKSFRHRIDTHQHQLAFAGG